MIIYTVTYTLDTGTEVVKKIASHEVNWQGYPKGNAVNGSVMDLLLAEGIDVRGCNHVLMSSTVSTDDPYLVGMTILPRNPIVEDLKAKEKEAYYDGEHAMELASINPDSAESLEMQARMYQSFGQQLGNIADKYTPGHIPLGTHTRRHEELSFDMGGNDSTCVTILEPDLKSQEVAKNIKSILNKIWGKEEEEMNEREFDSGVTSKRGAGMDGNEFITLARKLVARDYNENVILPGQTFLDWEEVYPVYISRDLQNNKGTFATPRADNIYYEITRNGDTNQAYIDRYTKVQNKAVELIYWDREGNLEPSKREQINVWEHSPKS